MFKEPTLENLLTDSANAFEDLYLSYKDDFFAFGKTFKLNTEELTDIYQEAFLSFYENLLNGKITQFTSSIKTYIFSIGKFKIYEQLRKNSKFKVIDVPINENITIDDLNLDSDILTEREQLVKANFKKLGKQCQQVLELFYLKGKTLNDIKIIKQYDNTDVVKSYKSRCLRQLKQLVNA